MRTFTVKEVRKYTGLTRKQLFSYKNSIEPVGYENNGNRSTVDPDDISTFQEFVITFDEFKAMLEASGLTMGYSTFEDILEDYRSYKPTVCKISKSKNKIKILVKE